MEYITTFISFLSFDREPRKTSSFSLVLTLMIGKPWSRNFKFLETNLGPKPPNQSQKGWALFDAQLTSARCLNSKCQSLFLNAGRFTLQTVSMHFNLLMWNLNWTKLLEVVSVLCHSLNLVGKTRYHQRKITGRDAVPRGFGEYPSMFRGRLTYDWQKHKPHPHNSEHQLGFPRTLREHHVGSNPWVLPKQLG